MAADVPIVATSVGGVPDVVSATEAVLVAPGEPRALAAGIWAVYCDAASSARRASAARVRLEREFDVGRWLARYEAVYRTVRAGAPTRDRKSTRLNSSHVRISYAVFCLQKKKNQHQTDDH